jgi:CDP-glucose 4,6-dehydratase
MAGRLPWRVCVDLSFWKGRRVLVTGHTGFKGAWLALWLERLGAEVSGLSLPAERPTEAYPSMAPWAALDESMVDIRDPEAVHVAVKRHNPEVVLHLAAQALVRRSYRDPVGTYETNVMGTVHLLKAVAATPSVRAAVVVTSDKVYANDNAGRAFREDDRLGHTDPYSNSKACAELVVTARAGNVIGGGDEAEDRLLPDVRRSVQAAEPVPIRYPDAVRPWQHVIEPVSGYLALAEALMTQPVATPHAVNFGPGPSSCRPVREVVERVLEAWGTGSWTHVRSPQPAEAALLELDSTLAARSLGWKPRLDLDEALTWTAEWWRAQEEGHDMRSFSTSQLADYECRMGDVR